MSENDREAQLERAKTTLKILQRVALTIVLRHARAVRHRLETHQIWIQFKMKGYRNHE